MIPDTRPMEPAEVWDAVDERHPLRGDELIVQIYARVGDDGELLDVLICDESGGDVRPIGTLPAVVGEVARAELRRQLAARLRAWHAMSARERAADQRQRDGVE